MNRIAMAKKQTRTFQLKSGFHSEGGKVYGPSDGPFKSNSDLRKLDPDGDKFLHITDTTPANSQSGDSGAATGSGNS